MCYIVAQISGMSRHRLGPVCTDIEHLTDYVMQEHIPENTQSAGVTWNTRRVVRRKPSMTVTGRGPVAASDQLAHHHAAKRLRSSQWDRDFSRQRPDCRIRDGAGAARLWATRFRPALIQTGGGAAGKAVSEGVHAPEILHRATHTIGERDVRAPVQNPFG